MSSDTLFAILGISFSAAIILSAASITICAIIDFKNKSGELGSRKIPKESVVHIDRKLFNEIVNDILLSVKPVYLRKEIASKMLDLTNRLIVDTRKETAEKFAEMLKEYFNFQYEFPCWQMKKRTIDKIDEICKELTEG